MKPPAISSKYAREMNAIFTDVIKSRKVNMHLWWATATKRTFAARQAGESDATGWQLKAREGEALLQREVAPPAGVVDA
jgi:hypothetical protein